jgi:hypothetical protein
VRMAVVSLLMAVATGFLLLRLSVPEDRDIIRSSPASVVLQGTLSFGLGAGVSSLLYFLWLLCVGAPGKWYPFAEVLLLAALAGVWALKIVRARKPEDISSEVKEEKARGDVWSRIVTGHFLLILCLAAAVGVLISLNRPHGNWDAWAMWNMKARFLYLGGDRWKDLFSVVGALHLDYPLLLPGWIARWWYYAGSDGVLVPAATSLLFLMATAGLLYAALASLAPGHGAILAGICMLGTASFLREGASQYADVPLAFYILATIVLLQICDQTGRGGYRVLAGISAGLAGWTKNEGAMFLLALAISHLAVVGTREGIRAYLRQAVHFFAGLAPVLAVLVYFKWSLAPPGGVVFTEGLGATLGKVLDISRHYTVLASFLGQFYSFGGLLYVVYFLLAGRGGERREVSSARLPVLLLALMSIAYYYVYLTTTAPLEWHLDTSLGRIVTQMFPVFLFAFFLPVRTPAPVLETSIPPAGKSRGRNRKRGK